LGIKYFRIYIITTPPKQNKIHYEMILAHKTCVAHGSTI